MGVVPTGFDADPFAPASTQFALAGTTLPEHRDDQPSRVGVRPWGLQRARLAAPGRTLPSSRYDEDEQKAIAVESGIPLIDLPTAGDPSAETTATVDGEDPPSSEDWDND